MNNTAHSSLGPVQQSERIAILDSLRGIALLGILLMNIPYFGMPDPAADNLTVLHELGTVNERMWFIINWVFEGTQRAIFSMLFGAGVLLFVSRLEKRSEGTAPADYFIRRQLWLLVFGLFDAYVLMWTGDILFAYAIAGIIVFAFRKLNPKQLGVAALLSLLLMTARDNRELYADKWVIRKGEKIARLDTTKTKLTEQQKDEVAAMNGLKEKSDSASMQKEMARNLHHVRGSYAEIYEYFSALSARFEFLLVFNNTWDILIFMFLGMAFFKTGLLIGNAPVRVYWLLFVVGSAVGLWLSYLYLSIGLYYKLNYFELAKHQGFTFYEIQRTFRSLGLFGLIMLLYKSGWFNGLFRLVRPVGQMAFTNYLMQSVLAGLFFYGIGFGMYGKLQRYEIYYVVGAIWIIEIVWSNLWLRHFRFGLMEWAWRSLTYWKRQPMRK